MRDHLSVACDSKEKKRWQKVASDLGYADFSAWVRAVLNAASGRQAAEGWESRLLHLEGDRIVPDPEEGAAPIVAFQVVAPGHFWRHVADLGFGETG